KLVGEDYREDVLPKWEVEYSVIKGIMRVLDIHTERRRALEKIKQLFKRNSFNVIIITAFLKYDDNDGFCFYEELREAGCLSEDVKVIFMSFEVHSERIINFCAGKQNLFKFNLGSMETEKTKKIISASLEVEPENALI